MLGTSRRRVGSRQRYLLGRIDDRAVLVAFVQRVIGAFHEDFAPLDQGGGEKAGKSANKNFLKECGVHIDFKSNVGASGQSLCGRCLSRRGLW